MRHASPLRYPGGKAAMTSVLRQIRHLNGLGGVPLWSRTQVERAHL